MFLSRFSIICLIGHWSWKIYINCPSSKPLPCSFPPGLSSPLPQALPHCLPEAPIQLFILLYPPTCVPPIPTYLYLCQLSRFCKLSLYLHHSLCPESCPHPLSTQPHTPLSCRNTDAPPFQSFQEAPSASGPGPRVLPRPCACAFRQCGFRNLFLAASL